MQYAESIYNHPEVRRLYEQFNAIIDGLEQEGKVRYGLAALAEVLQARLTYHNVPKDIPHASDLEYIMRAVTADIVGGDNGAYVLNKLTHGVECLMHSYRPTIEERRLRECQQRSGNTQPDPNMSEDRRKILFPN